MFSSISSSYNPLSNLNVRVKQNTQSKGLDNAQNSINSNSVAGNLSAKGANFKEVLGYKVDKDGYFTEEFNKVAGIPSDYKIHSSTMESVVRTATQMDNGRFLGYLEGSRTFESLDIAKTAGNAYKILSQVVGEEVLNSKDSFTLDEIANFPQGYEYHRQTMKVTKIHNSTLDYLNADLSFDWQNDNDIKINSLFFNTTENRFKNIPSTDIFNNNGGGKENVKLGVFMNTTPEKYTNADGSITKGGLLVAVMNANIYTKEGETTDNGKRQGFDKSMSAEEVKQARAEGMVLKFDPNDPNHYLYGIGEINPNAQKEFEEYLKNYKDPLTALFENMSEQQKLSLEELIEKQKELQQQVQKAVLEKTKKVDIEA